MPTQFQEQKITIDELAIMVQKGFTTLETGFNKRCNELETGFNKRCDDLEIGFNKRCDELETCFDKRFDELDTRIDSIAEQYTPKNEHTLLKARTIRIERKIGL